MNPAAEFKAQGYLSELLGEPAASRRALQALIGSDRLRVSPVRLYETEINAMDLASDGGGSVSTEAVTLSLLHQFVPFASQSGMLPAVCRNFTRMRAKLVRQLPNFVLTVLCTGAHLICERCSSSSSSVGLNYLSP